MSIAEKLVTATELIDGVYEAGKTAMENYYPPLYYINIQSFQWKDVKFPDDYHFILRLAKTPANCNGMLFNATGIKSLTMSCDDKSGTSILSQTFRESLIETVDLRDFNLKIKEFPYFIYGTNNLKTILGALDLSLCTNATSAFISARGLESIEFAPQSIVLDLDFRYSEKLTHESLISTLNGLRDMNINVDILNFRPDFTAENNDFTPGTYKISKVSLDPFVSDNQLQYIHLTTENQYHLRIAKQDCGENWEDVLKGFMVGNYLEIDGETIREDYHNITLVRLVSNPNGGTKTLTLGTTNLNKLTDEEKQIATNKGWVLK